MSGSEVENDMSISAVFDQHYSNADNKGQIDYWAPLAHLISECVEDRSRQNMTQSALAEKMKTKQSVISRFENMDMGKRLPSYDFVARLSIALGHSPCMSIFGEYSATVPTDRHETVSRLASEQNISTKAFLSALLERAIVELDSSIPREVALECAPIVQRGNDLEQPLTAGNRDTTLTQSYYGVRAEDPTKEPVSSLAA